MQACPVQPDDLDSLRHDSETRCRDLENEIRRLHLELERAISAQKCELDRSIQRIECETSAWRSGPRPRDLEYSLDALAETVNFRSALVFFCGSTLIVIIALLA